MSSTKRPSRTRTAAPLDAKYAYKTVKDTKNSYYMLSTMTLAAKLESYKGNADVSYGDYVLNGTIPTTVFAT